MFGKRKADLTRVRELDEWFEHTGDLRFLHEAIEQIGPQIEQRPELLGELGRLMVTRFVYTLSQEDLDEGVLCLRTAADNLDPDSAEFVNLSILAADALVSANEWFTELTGPELGDTYLDEAVRLLTEAGRSAQTGPAVVTMLMRVQLRAIRFDPAQDEVLPGVIARLRATPNAELWLTSALLLQHERQGVPGDLHEALSVSEQGAQSAYQRLLHGVALQRAGRLEEALDTWAGVAGDPGAPTMVRISAYHHSGRFSAELLPAAQALVDELIASAVTPQARELWLTVACWFAPMTVAALADAHQSPLAAVAFERARDTSRIQLHYEPHWEPFDIHKGRWRELARRHRMPRGGFLPGLNMAELQGAASGGPIVLCNVADNRTDAIIVRPDAIDVLPLNLNDVEHQVMALRQAQLTCATALRSRDGEAYQRGEEVIVAVLGWLWQSVGAPVLNKLGGLRPRIWWLPAGPLALLPLHAAGLPGMPGMLDESVSSYLPSVRHLREMRLRPQTTRQPEVLAVGSSALPFAKEEIHRLRSSYPSTVELTDPDRELVVRELGKHQWVHFACPMGGDRLALRDGTLSSLEVARLGMRQPELAFLSAGDAISPGFGHYRDVIGTLWSIDELSAGRLVEQFYTRMRDHGSPPLALNEAVRELRNQYPAAPGLWAPYYHCGP
ncbi:CHAT domain-containing protein [Pseudonocardiaceae bacterium YIM PH 21723]|nr:CHAT domain-containing protein [Pseudonocardiaceae bacterium YIM PH 21723]